MGCFSSRVKEALEPTVDTPSSRRRFAHYLEHQQHTLEQREPVEQPIIVKHLNIIFASGNFKFQSVIGKGGFGLVVSIKEKLSGKMFALKIENFFQSSARREQEIYEHLSGIIGIPECYGHWDERGYTLMRMELLGMNLSEFSRSLGRSMDKAEVASVAIQMIDIMKSVHNEGYVHCDIKPSNFAFGIGERERTLYLIDFGIAEKYVDPNGKHTDEYRSRRPKGTPQYMSVHIHNNMYNSRRDDMEGVVYTLLDMCHISLPWRHLCGPGHRHDHISLYGAKIDYAPSIPQLKTMLEMCRKMQFAEKPDYDGMKKLFKCRAPLFNLTKKPAVLYPRLDVLLSSHEKKILEKFHIDKAEGDQTDDSAY